MMDVKATWNGPAFGKIWVLSDDGKRAQCHICGRYFGNLGGHVSQVHGLSPTEYKRYFELNETTGLLGPQLRTIRQEQAIARTDTDAYQRFQAAGAIAREAPDRARRSTRGQRLRLEAAARFNGAGGPAPKPGPSQRRLA